VHFQPLQLLHPGMEHAVAGQLTFLANPTYAPKVAHTKASAILISESVRDVPIAP
jgi:UDP-3-O-[3-hydroxymyristoyl] glucosamine N-acyltransferase